MTDSSEKSKGSASRRSRVPFLMSESEAITQLRSQLEEKVGELTESNRQLKRKIFDLYTIFEISRNFNAVLKYQTLLDTFIFTCLGQVGALKGAIFLEAEGQPDCFSMAKGKGSGEFPTPEQVFPGESRFVEYLTRLNRPMLVAELSPDLATKDEEKILASFEGGIIVPLIYQTKLIGMFAIADKISGRQFQPDDLEFLSILGNQIAVAIENARLYEAEKMATQQLRAAQQQLLQTEKLAALGEMSAKIAHEVNNPLGIIKNYLLLIKRAAVPDTAPSKYTGIIEQEINRIAGIVRQLLEFHRPQPVSFDRIDMTQAVDDVLLLVERLMESSEIRVIRKYTSEAFWVLGSAENLKQVVLNLLVNARDAMPEGGSVTISMHRDQDEVVVDFCDTGPGIAPENIPKIFDPFFTTKDPGQGTGLGLSVCYGIIKSHNGSITFRNTSPGGCFEIRLPAASDGARTSVD